MRCGALRALVALVLSAVACARDKPLVLDAFVFNNEPIAFLRFELLGPFVDYFVVCESNVTFSGHARPFPSSQQPALLEPFREQIIWVQLESFAGHDKDGDSWQREHWSRDWLMERLHARFAGRKYIALVADADELADPYSVIRLRHMYDKLSVQPVYVQMPLFYYSFQWLSVDTPAWRRAFVVNDRFVAAHLGEHNWVSNFRWLVTEGQTLLGGWHCSSCMSASRVVEKTHSFSHTDYPKPSLEYVQECIAHGLDLFKRPQVTFRENVRNEVPAPACEGCRTLEEWIALVAPSEFTVDARGGAPPDAAGNASAGLR